MNVSFVQRISYEITKLRNPQGQEIGGTGYRLKDHNTEWNRLYNITQKDIPIQNQEFTEIFPSTKLMVGHYIVLE